MLSSFSRCGSAASISCSLPPKVEPESLVANNLHIFEGLGDGFFQYWEDFVTSKHVVPQKSNSFTTEIC